MEIWDQRVEILFSGRRRVPVMVPMPYPACVLLPQQFGGGRLVGGAGGKGGMDDAAAGTPGTPHVTVMPRETWEKASEVAAMVGVVLVATEFTPSCPLEFCPWQ